MRGPGTPTPCLRRARRGRRLTSKCAQRKEAPGRKPPQSALAPARRSQKVRPPTSGQVLSHLSVPPSDASPASFVLYSWLARSTPSIHSTTRVRRRSTVRLLAPATPRPVALELSLPAAGVQCRCRANYLRTIRGRHILVVHDCAGVCGGIEPGDRRRHSIASSGRIFFTYSTLLRSIHAEPCMGSRGPTLG